MSVRTDPWMAFYLLDVRALSLVFVYSPGNEKFTQFTYRVPYIGLEDILLFELRIEVLLLRLPIKALI